MFANWSVRTGGVYVMRRNTPHVVSSVHRCFICCPPSPYSIHSGAHRAPAGPCGEARRGGACTFHIRKKRGGKKRGEKKKERVALRRGEMVFEKSRCGTRPSGTAEHCLGRWRGGFAIGLAKIFFCYKKVVTGL